jgi:hypothetical protein
MVYYLCSRIQNTQTMKTTKKQNLYRVSDRAYRTIISDCIDSMTGCKIDPFTFKQVVTAVRNYLGPEGKITGLGRKAKPIFERLLPDLDRAIRRSSTARAAAARRNTAKKSAETEIKEPVAEPETDARPKLTAGTASVATPRRDKAPAERCARSASTCAVSSVGKRADSRPLSLRT